MPTSQKIDLVLRRTGQFAVVMAGASVAATWVGRGVAGYYGLPAGPVELVACGLAAMLSLWSVWPLRKTGST